MFWGAETEPARRRRVCTAYARGTDPSGVSPVTSTGRRHRHGPQTRPARRLTARPTRLRRPLPAGAGGDLDEEAISRYEQVASNLPPDVYQQSAQEVFAQLTPEQRVQLGQALIQSARQQGQSFPDVNRDGIDDRMQDPGYLAQTATQVQQEQPGLLSQLLGGRRGALG